MEKKRVLIPVLVIFGISLVLAGVFYFKTFNFTFTVKSPQDYLSIKYLVLNDSSRCDTFSDNDYQPFDNNIKDLGELEIGQYKRLCFLFESNSSNTITISHILEGNWDMVNIIEDNLNVTLDTANRKKEGISFTVNSTGTFSGNIKFGKGN
jgi:hypothetical protein